MVASFMANRGICYLRAEALMMIAFGVKDWCIWPHNTWATGKSAWYGTWMHTLEHLESELLSTSGEMVLQRNEASIAKKATKFFSHKYSFRCHKVRDLCPTKPSSISCTALQAQKQSYFRVTSIVDGYSDRKRQIP